MIEDTAPEEIQNANEVLYLTQIRILPVEELTSGILPVPAVMVKMDGQYGIDSKLPVTYRVMVPVAALRGVGSIFTSAADELEVLD